MSALRLLIAICLWLVSIPALAAAPANPLLAGDSIYVSHQGVHRLDLDSGKLLWFSLPGVETFAPVAWRDYILVGSTQGLYALDSNNGTIVWHIEKRHTVFSPSVSIQAFAGSVHGELYAVDPEHGRITWRRQFPGWIYSPVVNEVSAQLWTGGQPHRVYAMSLVDGSLKHELATTQETVFSPLDIGSNRVAFNLFDGNTLVIGALSGNVIGRFEGDAQPIDLHRYDKTVYRSHRDGSLAAFERGSLDLRWRKMLTAQDLNMHPSQPGYLLLSDRDRELILLDLEKNADSCHLHTEGNWILPIQIDRRSYAYFQKQMQPPGITLVQGQATCK